MNHHRLFAMIGLCAAGAVAQPAQYGGPNSDRQAAREQRRIELRTVLQASRQPDALASRAYDTAPAGRHLSARELAEMREQLRQQQAADQHTHKP